MRRLEIKAQYTKIATQILFSDRPVTRQDIESLDLFNSHHIDNMMQLEEGELSLLILDIITRKTEISF